MTAPVSQSTLDSLADAETLRLLPVWSPWAVRAGNLGQHAARWMRATRREIAPHYAASLARQAARAAFEAVPGLREP